MASEHDEAREANAGRSPARLTRADLVLLRKAARERWGVPDQLKTEALFEAAKILTTATKDRTKLAAIKALIEFDKVDQRDRVIDLAAEKLELQRNPDPSFDISQLTEEAERDAASYRPDERPGTHQAAPDPMP